MIIPEYAICFKEKENENKNCLIFYISKYEDMFFDIKNEIEIYYKKKLKT